MQILIPSRSRAQKLITPRKIPQRFHDLMTVYVAEEQLSEYVSHNPNLTIKSVSTLNDLLGEKLEKMAKDASDDLVMICDDDFTFFRRKNPHEAGLVEMEDEDWDDLFNKIEGEFEWDPNLYGVGVSMRQGNNRLEYPGERNTRLNGCIVYRRNVFLSAEHGRVNPMNDFDVNLQLLRRGYNNILLSEFCYNQPSTNSPGGSSDYRTLETQDRAAKRLCELHPGFVRLRQKENVSGHDEFRIRTEVTISWKKARKSAGE